MGGDAGEAGCGLAAPGCVAKKGPGGSTLWAPRARGLRHPGAAPLLGALEGGTAAGQGDTGRVREAGRHTRVGRGGAGEEKAGSEWPEAQARAARPDCGAGGRPPLAQGLRQAPRGKAAGLPPSPPPLGRGGLGLARRNGVHEHQRFS